MFSRALGLAVLACAALLGCSRPPAVHPALWRVEGPGGQQAWLFGTIHALPQPVEWRSAPIEAALAASDRLLLEVAQIDNDAATAQAFAALAQSPGLPPLEARVPPQLRAELAAAMRLDKMPRGALDPYETWAAALMLQQAAAQAGEADAANGIDRALLRGYAGPVGEFEGAAAQLAIFDTLPERIQRDLLAAAIGEQDQTASALRQLEQAWAKGDLAAIERETDRDFLTDPVLRGALLVNRNRAWLEKLTALLRGGARPFVAVGAAHLVGPDGLPALLTAQGYTVTRLQ